ncbi:MAG: glycoside hydrolase family 28 protein [Bryobacteraceae bacterium]
MRCPGFEKLVVFFLVPCFALAVRGATLNVKEFGAKADGKTPDRDPINQAIAAAAAANGGTVFFPSGTYLTGSIHLRSNVHLQFESGAVILASNDPAAYDEAESNSSTTFQDFGHSHWHNSLFWGENLTDLVIAGNGLINGKALTREARTTGGNKAIALKLCRNVTIRDISILSGGHFGILATGVDNLTIDNLKIDTNRDGIDIDGCHNVRLSKLSVNSPNDDAIVLKSSHALGYRRATEAVTIANCFVSGYDVGTLLDGTYARKLKQAPDRDGPTGRVKIGTESEGDFRNITIANIVFEHSRGLALESVDGAHIEDVAISNITMRDVSNSPIFIRLGSRMRAPEGTPPGSIRRVIISNVTATDADARYASIISGIPGNDVEDVTLDNIRLQYRGGLTLQQAADQPSELVNTFFFRASGGVPKRQPYEVPEREKEYPEPSMFGLLPTYGLYIRHAKGVNIHNLAVSYAKADSRPAFVIDNARDVDFDDVKWQKPNGVPSFVLRSVEHVTATRCSPLSDFKIERATDRVLQ